MTDSANPRIHPIVAYDKLSKTSFDRIKSRTESIAWPQQRTKMVVLLLVALMASCIPSRINAGAANLRSSVHALPSASESTALMLAVQDGPAGERNLREWANFAEHAIFELPPIWAIHSEISEHAALVKDLAPHIQPFVVTEGMSWATVFSIFRDQVCQSKKFAFHGVRSRRQRSKIHLDYTHTYPFRIQRLPADGQKQSTSKSRVQQ